MVVILAIEESIADVVLLKLREIKPFNDPQWEFRICTEAKKLLHERKPDVIVISRALPNLEKNLSQIKKKFSDVRIVWLVGRVNDRSKAFMQKIEGMGFRQNFVKGDLPGDRPYILPFAILNDYDDFMNGIRRQQYAVERSDDSTPGHPPQKALPVLETTVVVLGDNYNGLQSYNVIKCNKVTEIKKLVKERNVDAVLVEYGRKDAGECIKTLRRTDFSGFVLVYNGYDTALIRAGASGCLKDAAMVSDYLGGKR